MLTRKSLYQIYLNIHAWAEYRAAKKINKVTEQEFKNDIAHGYHIITFQACASTVPEMCGDFDDCREVRRWRDICCKKHKVNIFVFPDDTKFSKKENMRKMLSKNKADEQLLLYGTWSAFVIKAATELSKNSGAFVRIIPRNKYHINIRDHVLSPKFEIAEVEDVTRFMEFHKMDAKNLPRTYSNDAVSIYCGAIPGQVIKYYPPSQVTGETVTYRICAIHKFDKQFL